MEEEDKLPLKRVEFSLTKFNEVAIPHHLDLLRQHKANIIKYEEGGEYARVRSEQTHARRVASQLRALLGELEALRRRVRLDDLPRFDALTRSSRDNTLKAIMDYLGIIESSCRALVSRRASSRPIDTSPLSANRRPVEAVEVAAGSTVSSESVGVLSHHDEVRELELSSIQLQVNDQESSLREREAALRGWCELQGEVRALHEAWQHVQAAALHHRHQNKGRRVGRQRSDSGSPGGGTGGGRGGDQGGSPRCAGWFCARIPGGAGARRSTKTAPETRMIRDVDAGRYRTNSTGAKSSVRVSSAHRL
uniref:STX17-like N-terminal domain-containing protein n=1 Tax=Bombyx mori TaxID=7091 RepID=A0A8R2R897_BOMMO|nr:uncharacterized protein LOC101747035 isoform X1 [Bombyx mori]